MSLESIYQALARAGRLGGRLVSPDAWYHAGLETQRPGGGYFWDGMRRPGGPFVVFQATVSGWGAYASDGGVTRLDSGKAFLAVVPSAHRYYLPEDSSEWTYFFLLIRHPYVVQRLASRQAETGAVFNIPADSLLLSRAVTLCAGGFSDRFSEERALFSLVTEFDRFAHSLSAAPERETLEAEVRGYVLAQLTRPVDVAELARRNGMSRSRFSHHFKAQVGIPPAAFMTEIRLEEAARRLTQSDFPLSTIATETGFADANHLCKVFKRRFHVSPGAFRRQVRG